MEDSRRFFSVEQEIDKHRNRLPHWQQGAVWCFVTWRLADSVPASLLKPWEDAREMWLRHHPRPWDEETEGEYHGRFSRQMEEWLDQGAGECLLRHSECAEVVAASLRHSDGKRYEMRAFVVMPNHVHALFRPMDGFFLGEILKGWKGYTARQLNLLRSRQGTVWQRDYWDILIRDEAHFYRAEQYIRRNPEKAGLKPGEYVLG